MLELWARIICKSRAFQSTVTLTDCNKSKVLIHTDTSSVGMPSGLNLTEETFLTTVYAHGTTQYHDIRLRFGALVL